jgi:ArsR family transcriptional regulator
MDHVIRLMKTLSDATRLRLLRLVSQEELTVGEIAASTNLAQSRVSNHLKILRDEGLLVERHEGAWHYYRLASPLPESAQTFWPEVQKGWKSSDFFPDDLVQLEAALTARTARSQAYFERVASEWDSIRDNLFADSLAKALLAALLPNNLTVADIGTGTGYIPQLLGDNVDKIIAIDSATNMLSMAKLNAEKLGQTNIDFRQGDAENPPLKANEVNVITMMMLIHHLVHPGVALQKAADALQPGGTLIIADYKPHEQKWLQEHMEHRWLGFTRNEVEEWLTEAGFQPTGWVTIPGGGTVSIQGRKLQIPDAFLSIATLPVDAKAGGGSTKNQKKLSTV